jgi:hypothetical protein
MFSILISLAMASASANGTDKPPAKPAKPRKVCEQVEGGIGSRLSQRVCRVVEPAKPKEEAVETSSEKQAASTTD